jgi:hypothetical protein
LYNIVSKVCKYTYFLSIGIAKEERTPSSADYLIKGTPATCNITEHQEPTDDDHKKKKKESNKTRIILQKRIIPTDMDEGNRTSRECGVMMI